MAAGRPRSFDADKALDRAMHVFWRKGYDGTSLSDLTRAMRINAPSLYAAFGDKRTLFLQAIDHYGELEVARVFETLSHPQSMGNAIARFFAELVEQIVDGHGRTGCFIGNTAVEVAAHDREVAMTVRRNLDRIEAAFRNALAQARARSQVPEEVDIDALARFFVAGTQGLRLIGKTTSDRGALESIAEHIVAVLRCDG